MWVRGDRSTASRYSLSRHVGDVAAHRCTLLDPGPSAATLNHYPRAELAYESDLLVVSELRANVTMGHDQSGHMMFIHRPSLEQLREEVGVHPPPAGDS